MKLYAKVSGIALELFGFAILLFLVLMIQDSSSAAALIDKLLITPFEQTFSETIATFGKSVSI